MTVEFASEVYCQYNDVGRTSWIENLTARHPTGDCDGEVLRVVVAPDLTRSAMSLKTEHQVFLCERHFLQMNATDKRFALAGVSSQEGDS